MSELPWHVAHTKPRCEKKLAEFCDRESVERCLPCYKSVRRYRGKKVVFLKPLFPGYLFLRIHPEQTRKVYQSDYVANLLSVMDQELFERQLEDILFALESDVEIMLAPVIQPGSRVLIKSGPLRGMEGWVETRQGMTLVQLRLDFIGQAALAKVDADDLELVG